MVLNMEKTSSKNENDEEREVEEWIDAKPKKRIITNKAMRCGFNQAMAEIVDNCLDYWGDLDRPKKLKISIKIENAGSKESMARVEWNTGVPRERWRPLLTPGEVLHRSPTSIGVWGEGFKIAIFATGEKIDIGTSVDGEQFHIDIPKDFLGRDDWRIPVFKGPPPGLKVPKDYSIVLMKGEQFNEHPSDLERLRTYLSEVFGTKMRAEEKGGPGFSLRVNGKKVDATTFCIEGDIPENFSFTPGFEPSIHRFREGGLDITMILGLLSMADKENYGVFMYGNFRLFAKAVRDERLGFGVRANSRIPMNHPLAMRLQIHVFFEGESMEIPWRAPLKDYVDLDNSLTKKVGKWIKTYATPYAEFMKNAKASEFIPYSIRWNDLNEDERIDKILTKKEKEELEEEEKMDGWRSLPKEFREGFDPPKNIEYWDHLASGRGHKPSDSPKFDRSKAKNVVAILRRRDKREITTFDVHNAFHEDRLDTGDLKAILGTSEVEKKKREQLKELEDPLFDPAEGSVTLSVRMDATEANELSVMTKERKKSIILKKVLKTYKSFQDIKGHPYLMDKKKNWTDKDLIDQIETILNAQLPR
jgi:hypothetical protein